MKKERLEKEKDLAKELGLEEIFGFKAKKMEATAVPSVVEMHLDCPESINPPKEEEKDEEDA